MPLQMTWHQSGRLIFTNCQGAARMWTDKNNHTAHYTLSNLYDTVLLGQQHDHYTSDNIHNQSSSNAGDFCFVSHLTKFSRRYQVLSFHATMTMKGLTARLEGSSFPSCGCKFSTQQQGQ
eukprot:1540968-Ditylum_brightwellii.AAC.1